MPAALLLGAPPAIVFAAVHKLPKQLDELAVAGGLVGAPIRVCKAKTVDLIVPAEAEIVIEGFIDTEWLEPEAQFRRIPRLHEPEGIQRLHGRDGDHAAQDAVLVSIISQVTPSESSLIKRVASSRVPASFAPPPQHFRRHPRVHARAADQSAQAGGDPVAAPTRRRRGLARALRRCGLFLLGRQDIIAVNEDIEPENLDMLFWAMAYRMRPHQDMRILPIATWATAPAAPTTTTARTPRC